MATLSLQWLLLPLLLLLLLHCDDYQSGFFLINDLFKRQDKRIYFMLQHHVRLRYWCCCCSQIGLIIFQLERTPMNKKLLLIAIATDLCSKLRIKFAFDSYTNIILPMAGQEFIPISCHNNVPITFLSYGCGRDQTLAHRIASKHFFCNAKSKHLK